MMNTDILGEPQFELGNIFTTPGADEMIADGLLADLYIDRHWRGDWGDIDEEDKEANEEAITHGDRLLSCFDTPVGRLWIITEADRSTTTLMTPEEY
jgi:hypothetical protein